MNLLERIDRELATVSAHRKTAEDARSELSLELIRDPANETLHQQLADLEKEIAEHVAKISRLQAARTAAAREDTAEAKQARAKELANVGNKVKGCMRKREQLAEQVDAHIAALGPLLKQWAAVSDECKDLLWTLARGAAATIDQAGTQNALFLRIAKGDGGRAPAALAKQLYNAQVGKVGIIVDPQFIEIGRADTVLSVTEAARADTDRLAARVDELLAQSVRRLEVTQ